MTGIERLRKLSYDFTYCRLWYALLDGTEEDWGCYRGDDMTVSDVLEAIADQIVREHAEECFRMGERAAEDREAVAWVRKHGGLDEVRAEWRSRVPYDLYERRRQRLLGHIAECETALGRRNHRIEKLGRTIEFFQLNNSNFRHLLADVAERLGFTRFGDDYEPEDLLDALDRRLMPEGMEWMLWDDGKPVTYDDAPDDVIGVYLALDGSGYALMTDLPDQLMSEPSERVKRPAVLAADGEPLEVGQTVWDADGMEFRVESFDSNGVWGAWKTDDGWIKAHPCPTLFTHQRPVLDADGVPIRKGDTVWHIETGREYVVVEPSYGETVVVRLAKYDDAEGEQYAPDQLTHTKPESDSWERVEEDATLSPEVYCHRNGIDISQKDGTEIFLADTVEPMALDLVRRCRALAERERSE